MKTNTSSYESTPTIDLVKELSSNSEQYRGADTLTLGRGWLPAHINYHLDRVRFRVSPEPNFSIIVACCVWHGTSVIRSREDVRSLLQLKRQLVEELELDPTDISEIFGFQSMNLSSLIGNNSYSSQPDSNVVRLPKPIKKSIKDLAGQLGMTDTIVVTLSTMFFLSSQVSMVSPDHRDRLEREVSTFIRKVCLRRDLAELLLNKA